MMKRWRMRWPQRLTATLSNTIIKQPHQLINYLISNAMTALRILFILCLGFVLASCKDKAPETKRPQAKPKLVTMDACERLPASVVAEALALSATPTAKTERFEDDHFYAGGCRYLDAAGNTRALFGIKIDENGSHFHFIPIRWERSNFHPTKPVAKHEATRYYDGGLWWTSKENVMFQLWLYNEDGQSVLQDDEKHHAVAEKIMEGYPIGDMPDAPAPQRPVEQKKNASEQAKS